MKISHQQHRIIREKGEGNRVGSNGSLLEPILHHAPHKSNIMPQVQTHNPQHIPGLFPRIDTSSDRDQLTNLQQRIKELEKENFRLAHHVQQAEHSLRNYREVLAAYNININHVISTPGKSNALLQIPPRPQEIELEKKYQYATKQIEELLTEKLRISNLLSESGAECSSQRCQLEEERQLTSQLQQQLLMTKTQHDKSSAESASRIEELLKENDELKRLKQQKLSAKVQPNYQNNNLQPLLAELNSLRSNEQVLRTTYTQEMQSLNTFVEHSLQELQSVAMFAQRELNCKRQELVAAKVDKELIMLTMQQQIDILQSRLLQAESSQPRTPAKMKTPSPTPKKAEKDQLLQQHEQQMTQQEKSISALQSQLQAQQTSFSQLQSDHSKSEETHIRTLNRLEKASSALHGLQEVHSAEVKAIKHLAHVRELLRVAKEREAGLERDRLAIEIKHLKEVQSIMTFSLGTAEQSLIELQPHVVTKLVEGRSKRILQLEQSYKGRLKDVEQRSSETCAVSTHHLEQFHKKALENQKTAENMTKIAVDEVKQFLV